MIEHELAKEIASSLNIKGKFSSQLVHSAYCKVRDRNSINESEETSAKWAEAISSRISALVNEKPYIINSVQLLQSKIEFLLAPKNW